MADRGLDPRTWKRRHLAVWAGLTVLGGAAGMAFGWLVSPFSRLQAAGTSSLLIWLHYPQGYWPYALAGAVTFGLAYYAADLLTGAR